MNDSNESAPLYDRANADELERLDRLSPIPGSEPPCPVCGTRTYRLVEAHPAPRTDESPFRVRLLCRNDQCRRWLVYNW
ncbi:MAG: hypothetical protein V3U38_06210 [Gemmatimonadota bacterium]